MAGAMLRRCAVLLCFGSILTLSGSAADPAEDDIQLWLYTRAHPVTRQLLANQSAEGIDFNATKPVVVVIHGFMGSGDVPSVILMRDAFLYMEDVQVLVVHWKRLAQGPNYTAAASNTGVVAAHLAAALQRLILEEGLQQRHLHIVGFSLGAQVAGIAGAIMDDKPARITGLDPARPSFDKRDRKGRLDASDAVFVLVLHTSGGFLSFEDALGHADFYPNGGQTPQPHCVHDELKEACSHMMAPAYFAESIYKSAAFPAVRCQSWGAFDASQCKGNEQASLGPNTPASTRGTFYLRTNADEPYGIGSGQRTGRQHDVEAQPRRPTSNARAIAASSIYLALAAFQLHLV